jgi:phosphoserine phosphatase
MGYVAVIVAKESLPARVLDDLRADLALTQEVKWLDASHACEIPFNPEGNLDGKARLALAQLFQDRLGLKADIGIFHDQNRRKKLLLADMDSTIIEQECLDELAEEMGIKAAVAKITERAMRGEIDFDNALRERVVLLKGLALQRLQAVIEKKITFTPGAKTLVETMKAHGAATALVSGGFTLFTQHVAEKLGFDVHFANTLDYAGDRLAGTVTEPVLGAGQKRQILLDLCKQKGLEPEDALAIGDGANDRFMIEAAGMGLGYRAKPVLAKAADALVMHGDLGAALYFQGYAKNEFIS